MAGRKAKSDWYLLDVAGLLDRIAARRYIDDPNARPPWWTPYPLPPALAELTPTPDSRFLAGDGHGGRATGGLFSLDGVHPTTVAYGMIAQELVNIMRLAGVPFRQARSATERLDPVTVDFARLIRRDTLISSPPQNITPGLHTLGWADKRCRPGQTGAQPSRVSVEARVGRPSRRLVHEPELHPHVGHVEDERGVARIPPLRYQEHQIARLDQQT